MKNKFVHRLLVYAVTGSMIVGSCSTAFAAPPDDGSSISQTVVTEEAEDSSISVSLLSDTEEEDTGEITATDLSGGETISENGVYNLAEGATGVITLDAKEVTLVGKAGVTYTNLALNCTQAGTSLTLQDVQISVDGSGTDSAVSFTGAGNFLYLAGTNVIDSEAGSYAAVHVGTDTELTLADASGDETVGILYLYKSAQAAGIGGDSGEINGKITFESGSIFAKGSKQGAVIGTGANASGTPGDISIKGGELNLLANARGALIGGGAGSSGGTAGGKVYVSGGTTTLNVDFTGAAIGGGGYDAGNDAAGGQVVLTGGSLRTFVDANAYSSWGLDAYGVSDKAITAEKVNDKGEAVSMLKVDTSQFASAKSYTVKVDGKVVYKGGLHQYKYVNEDLDKDNQTAITDTKSNWTALTDSNLYLYATKANHTVTVNGVNVKYVYDSETDSFAPSTTSVNTAVTGEGDIIVSNEDAKKGDTVTITTGAGDGYYLAQVRYAYETETAEGAVEEVYETLVDEDRDGVYTLVMPDDSVSITADYISKVWDGTIDLTWYDPEKTTYNIQYAAQLAGVAALDNGLFNNYPVVENTSGKEVPNVTEDHLPYGYSECGYNVFGTEEASTAVVGDITQLKAYCSTGSTGSNNQVTTNDYWYGPEDYDGKTINLTADLDMGGSYTGSDKTNIDAWSGPNYMPIGGQYVMDVENGYTHEGSSFNGTLDGQGHMIYNVYCNRYTAGSYGDSQSIGIIGRMGVHDNDPKDLYANPCVKNLAVDGVIYGRRSVGGVVGKTGKSNGAVIRNCVNFATVRNTDAKGCGGIVGAGWNQTEIYDCANFGYIYTGYNKNAGGIAGSNEAATYNCYNFGFVGGSTATAAQSLGTNNGGASWTNCYYLKDSSSSTSQPAIYNPTKTDTYYEVETAEDFKTDEFLSNINGTGRGWVSSSDSKLVSSHLADAMKSVQAYTSERKSYDVTGVPVPRTFAEDTSRFINVSTSGVPVTDYIEGQSFDAGSLVIWANYSDNTREAITDYTVTYQSGSDSFALGDTKVSVTGTYNGESFSFIFPVSVEANALSEIKVSTQPKNTLYASGEKFDATGMVVKAYYTNGLNVDVTDEVAFSTDALTAGTENVTVSYTYKDQTMTADVPITVLSSAAPQIKDGVAQISSADELVWFSNQIKIGKQLDAILLADIDLTGTAFQPIGGDLSKNTVVNFYTGTFDGNGKTVTLDLETSNQNIGLFAGISAGAIVKNVTVDGKVSGTYYIGAITGRMSGGRIENCVSKAAISGTGMDTGGIVGYAMSGDMVVDCINEGTVYSTSNYVGGIVGYLSGGVTVSDCINRGDVKGSYNVAGIAGYISNGTVKNCGNEGTISATKTSGGISYVAGGVAGYTTNATIDSCYNKGTVEGMVYLGGITGITSLNVSVTNCYNLGAVNHTLTGSGVYAGGIIGNIYNVGTTVKNCYSAGTVTTATTATTNVYVGSIAGYAKDKLTNVKNNYAITSEDQVLMGYNTTYTDEDAKTVTSDELKKLADVSAETGVSVLGSAYVASENAYPILSWENPQADTKTVTAISAKTVNAAAVYVSGYELGKDDLTVTVTYSDGTSENVENFTVSPAKLTTTTQKVLVSYGNKAVSIPVKAYDVSWYGDGTATEYTMSSAAQLASLAHIVNGTITGVAQDSFAGKTIKQSADIAVDKDGKYTMKEGTFGNANYAMKTTYPVLSDDASIWTPIGSATATANSTLTNINPFAGTYDGCGHAVTGIYTDRNMTVQGMFGYVTGTVKNLTVNGCVSGKMVVGGIAAVVSGGTVENCTNNAVVYADGGQEADSGLENGVSRTGAVGGIIGNLMGTENTVKNCMNNGPVFCTNTNRGGRTAGIVGLIDAATVTGTISYCGNTADIDSYQYTGGIVGMNASASVPIDNCFNTGKVTGHSSGSTYVGGIVALSSSSISNCYNTGDYAISCDGSTGNKAAHFGGIISDLNGTATVTNCYNTGHRVLGGGATTYSSTGAICGTGYGNASSNKLINCYTTVNEGQDLSNGCVTFETDLSAAMLGAAFKDNCGSTPVLTWQESTEHTYTGAPSFIWQADNTCITRVPCTAEGCEHREIFENTVTETVEKAATCTETGIRVYTASVEVNGKIYTNQKLETIPVTDHTWDEGVKTPATCTEDGKIVYTCTTCQETMEEVIPATGHNYVVDEAVAPTCTEKGWTKGAHCTDCGDILIPQEEIPATGHSFGEWVVEKEATTTEEGLKVRTCSVCGEKETEVILMKAAWVKDSTGWKYRDSDYSYPADCWKCINEKWYHFDENGYMESGWQYINSKWYYLGDADSGYMRTGWQKINNKWYYLGAAGDGSMKSGWQKINNKWYYFGAADDGAMKTGWQYISGKWYYLGDENDGSMKTGWIQLSGKWYYLASDGAMVTGTQYIGGKWYTFGSDGAMK